MRKGKPVHWPTRLEVMVGREVVGHVTEEDGVHCASYKGSTVGFYRSHAGAELAVLRVHNQMLARGITTSAPAAMRNA